MGVPDWIPGGSTGDQSVELPDGFGKDGIDLDAALGPSSAMATVSSVSLHSRREIVFSFATINHSEQGYFSQESDTFHTESRAFDGMTDRITIVGRYYRKPALVERRKVEPRALAYRKNQSRHEMDPHEDYRLNELHRLAGDVSFSSPTVRSIETGHPDQRDGSGRKIPVAVYRAGIADFAPGSLLEQASPSLGEFVDGSVEFEVDERGFIHRFVAGGTYETIDGNLTTSSFEWDYFDFGTTTVTKPNWVGELPDDPPPEVTVEFDETDGQEVHVHVLTMEYTEQVGVGVVGVGTSGVVSEPGTIVIPADSYLLDDGAVAPIAVIAEDRIEGPVQVAAYQPAPAGEA